MHLVDIDLSHQDMLTAKFLNLNLDISEYSFSNVYLFRKVHHYQLYFKKDLFLKGVTRSGSSYLMPTFPIVQSLSSHDVLDWITEVDFLFPIPEQWLPFFDSKIFEMSYSEDDSDYLYAVDKMQTYAGRHLSSRRNLVKQLIENHQVDSKPLTHDTAADALEILEHWQQSQDLSNLNTDYISCKEALQLYEKLNLNGIIYYIDQKPEGFLLGERLGKTSIYAIHFSKADRSVKGLYQYLFQNLAQSLDTSYQYLNMEQDLGIPEVRQNKHSYQPDHLVRKWRISKK